MKVLLTLASIFFVFEYWAQISVYDCSVTNPAVTQAEIDAQPNFYKSCVLFEQPTNYQFDVSDDNLVEAINEIRIEENFNSGQYSSGKMHLKINPNRTDFDVALMNYPNLDHVVRYEKFELGVDLPEDIQTVVDNFVNNSAGVKLNPYMDWDLRVYGEFIAPTGQGVSVDGFYNKEFDSYMQSPLPAPANGHGYSDAEYAAVGGYTETPDPYSFRIRFAPPINGAWKCRVHVVTQNQHYTSEFFDFNVVQGNNLGYIQAGDRYFTLGNETFFPVGSNAPWPETYRVYDPDFADVNQWSATNTGAIDEGYRPVPAAPRVYDTYRNNILKPMMDNGANMIRTIMYPASTEIEWEELGNYTSRLTMAQEMDEILELAESNDAYLLWDLQIHYSFQKSANAYGRRWTWDKDNFGDFFCYRDLLGDVSPTEFLTDPAAKAYYKQRLRYILARWGYSTNIGIFEIMSEISNIGAPTNDAADYYLTGSNYTDYRDWQWEMGNYIRSHYNGNIHMLTCSFAGSKAEDDNVFSDANSPFDVMGSNIYDFAEPSNSKFWIDNVGRNHLNEDGDNSYTHVGNDVAIKPMIYAEVGVPEVEKVCKDNHIETKRIIWQAPFSGLAGSFGYDSYWRPDVFQEYGLLGEFMSQFDLEGGGWHPGSVEKNGSSWEFKQSFADRMVGDNERADLSYLRSADGNYAIGVITNLTYNAYSAASCFDSTLNAYTDTAYTHEDSLWNSLPGSVMTFTTANENLKLKGMKYANYVIDYFLPSDLSTPFASSSNFGPNVLLEPGMMGANYDKFIVVFKARKITSSWSPTTSTNPSTSLEKSAITLDKLKFKAYPVPSNEYVILESPQDGLTIQVTSLEGKMVDKIIVEGKTHELDITKYESGTYLVHFFDGDHLLHQLRIVKI